MSDLTVIEKLDDIIDSKSDIKYAISEAGQHPTEVLSTYAGLIENISSADLPIIGTDISVYVEDNIPKGSRFVGTPMDLGGIEVSVLATFEDDEYEIYPSATVMSQDGKVAVSLLEGNKGRVCILREDGTKYRYIFDVEKDTNITPTSAKVGTHMSMVADGTLALYSISYDISGHRYFENYILKINRAYGMESVTLFSGAGSGLNDPEDLSNTQIMLAPLTNNLILTPEYGAYGGFIAVTYTLATIEGWYNNGQYGMHNVIELGSRFGVGDHPLKPRTFFEDGGICYAIGYGNHDGASYELDDKEVVIAQYYYRGDTNATRTRFSNKISLDYKSTVSTNKEYLIVTTAGGCDIYKLDSTDYFSISGGPYSFPFAIRQFDGTYAITDDKYYYIISVEDGEYQLLGSHNLYNVGTGDMLSCTYVPASLSGTWAGITQVNGKDVPCVLQGVISDVPINVGYTISLDTTGVIEERNIYGIASRDLTRGTTETVKYSFKDEHLNTTAVADDIVIGRSAYSNGEYLTGTYEGILTNDATATSSDIAKDKTVYARGQKITGNVYTYEGQGTDDTVSANTVTETNSALSYRYTFNDNTMFRNRSSITTNASKQSVVDAIGLTGDILKRDENILGVLGTFDGIDYDENVEIAKDILGIS